MQMIDCLTGGMVAMCVAFGKGVEQLTRVVTWILPLSGGC